MPTDLEHLESFLGRNILISLRGRDAKLLIKSEAFIHHP